MPDELKSGVENLSGVDMSDVKAQMNATALPYMISTNVSRPKEIVQRRVTVGATDYDTATAAFTALSPGLPALNPLRLRSVISQYNHDDATFVDVPTFRAAATTAVQALAAAAVVGLWTDERLEAKTTEGGSEYTFSMSFKHLKDTYMGGTRAYGGANPDAQGVNTILNLGDADIMTRFCALVEDVRANVLATAGVHPHQLAPNTNRTIGGITYVVEGTQDVHVYPIAGAATLNFTNPHYYALVDFARWRRSPNDNTLLNTVITRLTDINAAAARINAVTGVGNCVTVIQDAITARDAAAIGAEVTKINTDLPLLHARVQALRARHAARIIAPTWNSDMKRHLANTAITVAEQEYVAQQAIITGIVGLNTLSARVANGTITVQAGQAALAPGTTALETLRAAVVAAEGNYATQEQEDIDDGQPVEEGGMFSGML